MEEVQNSVDVDKLKEEIQGLQTKKKEKEAAMSKLRWGISQVYNSDNFKKSYMMGVEMERNITHADNFMHTCLSLIYEKRRHCCSAEGITFASTSKPGCKESVFSMLFVVLDFHLVVLYTFLKQVNESQSRGLWLEKGPSRGGNLLWRLSFCTYLIEICFGIQSFGLDF